jgi:two-component system, OmpR family, sensor histidine kinase KdpD
MPANSRRRTPEELLREVQAEEAAGAQGRLKVFLGYASGVGKSFRMLDEARRRRKRGQDVVVGGIQPQVSPEVEALLRNLEVIPLRSIGDGTMIDMDSLLRRRPKVCIIDGLAYDNPPGARNPSRWQDVQQLLDTGIDVIASVNIQHIAELAAHVSAITGKRVRETVPVAFIRSASEIEIVDAPSDESLERSADQQLDAAKREQQLSRLRELALVLAADVVDHQLTNYLERYGIRQQFRAQERILVCITPRANIHEMMETALIIASKFHAELIAAYVNQSNLPEEDRAALEERLLVAQSAGAHLEILEGDDPAETILRFARQRGITQIFVGHTQRSGFKTHLFGSPIDRLIDLATGMDVRVFPQ